MIVALVKATNIFSAIAIGQIAEPVPLSSLEIASIVADKGAIKLALAFMWVMELDYLIAITFIGTFDEMTNVARRAVIRNKLTHARNSALIPFTFIRPRLGLDLTDSVTLARKELAFVHVFILLLHLAESMPQAFFELANVDCLIKIVDIFAKAVSDTIFPLSIVCFIVSLILVNQSADSVYFTLRHLAFVS